MAADVESVVIAGLNSVLSSVTVATDTPDNLQAVTPFVKVVRIGGADATPGLDAARVDVDCFAATSVAAATLALQVHDLLRFSLIGYTGPGGHINAVSTDIGPSWRPYQDLNVRSYGASYVVTVHSL